MPVGKKSYRPGDVIRSMSGITIEILNTDAEGRVDFGGMRLTYAKKLQSGSDNRCSDFDWRGDGGF